MLSIAPVAAQTTSAAGAEVQTAAQAGPPAEDVELITVTASRIQRLGFEAPTPTTVIGADEIAQVAATNVGELLNELPAFMAAQTPTAGTLSNNAGANYLDLRGLGLGLGIPRTLVLVNGRRHVPTTSGGVLDTNVIPSELIERVEVVTGGASAAWGSDAVAGVVNFIFDNDLKGLRGTVQAGISERGDYEEWRASVGYGTAFAGDRGHFVVAAEAVDNNGIRHQDDRAWGARGWGLVNNDAYVPGSGEFQRIAAPNAKLSIATEGGLILSGPLRGTQFGPGGAPIPFQFGKNVGLFMEGGDGVNMGSYTALAVPLSRVTGFSRASFEFTPSVTGFVELSAAQTKSHNPNIVQPFDFGTSFIRQDNAYLPAAVRTALVTAGAPGFALGRVNTDFGFIEAKDKSETLRAVVGLDGRINDAWTWNAYYQYGQNERTNQFLNNLVVPNYALAVDAVISPATGAPVCRSTLTNPNNGCVPLNLFGFGSPSAAAIDYVTADQLDVSEIAQHVAAVTIQGRPFSTWAGPVAVAAGAEYRREEVHTKVDELAAADAFLVGNPKALDGDEDIREAFAEISVPLLSEAAMAQSLDVDLAFRLTDYSSSGTVETWKVGTSWEPVSGLRFRATRSRDIRAPNISELYAVSSLSFANIQDPVSGDLVLIRSPNIPNPNLEPEKADTLTLGAVLQPSWLRGFRAAVDLYRIEVNGVISTLTPQDVVSRCAAGASELCAFVQRDAGGSLVQVNRANINLSELTTRGVDLDAAYATGLGAGRLTLRLLATYIESLKINDGTTVIDRAGDVGVRGGVPHWRGRLTGTYEQGPASFYLAGRYVGGGSMDSSLPADAIGPNDYSGRLYVDTSVEFTVLDQGDRQVRVFGRVENLFDRDPPIVPADFIAPLATNPIHYDVIGRRFQVGARVRF